MDASGKKSNRFNQTFNVGIGRLARAKFKGLGDLRITPGEVRALPAQIGELAFVIVEQVLCRPSCQACCL